MTYQENNGFVYPIDQYMFMSKMQRNIDKLLQSDFEIGYDIGYWTITISKRIKLERNL